MSVRPLSLASYPPSTPNEYGLNDRQWELGPPDLTLITDERITLFNVDPGPCPNPRVKYSPDPITGELTLITQTRFDRFGNELIDGCEKYTCFPCAVRKARRIAGAIYLAEPDYTFYLTLVGSTASEITKKLSKFAYIVRKRVPGFEWAWAAEPNPGRNGNHVHGYIHTHQANQRQLEVAFEDAQGRVGLGQKSKVRPVPIWAKADYFGYPLKGLAEIAKRETFLELNRSQKKLRLIHSSNDFWRYGKEGPIIDGRDDAEALALWRSGMR